MLPSVLLCAYGDATQLNESLVHICIDSRQAETIRLKWFGVDLSFLYKDY